jgi:cyclic lactone autoinducer peptide
MTFDVPSQQPRDHEMTRAAIVLATILMLAGSASAAEMCPMIYQPVCAVKHGHHKTYSNACVARGAHARVVHDGECRTHN